MTKQNIVTLAISLVVSTLVLMGGLFVLNKIQIEHVASVSLIDEYEIVAGVIRNSASDWELIKDKGHETIGISNIAQNDEFITIHYPGMTKVNSMSVTVDETMASEGYTVGASVGISETNIYIYNKEGNLVNPRDYINQSGNIWIQGILKK